jgi:hypothetical protein
MPYALPTDHERRALFAWLKQASSLAAWRRLYSFHQAFLDSVQNVYEQEQRNIGTVPTIPTDWYASILTSHDGFAAALSRLQHADRRCFAFLGSRGHLSEGLLQVKWWQNMYAGSFSGRNGFTPADSPRWSEIEQPMHDCLAALSDIDVVLQERFTDMPAPIDAIAPYRSDPTSSLIKHWLAQPSLPPVPAITHELLVPTGSVLPCYGIWEPVRVGGQPPQAASGAPVPLAESRNVDGRLLDGCMNYLLGDFAAPTIAFPEDDLRREGRSTTWRLVWRDERYGDNPIPEEEQDYVFVQPAPGEVLFRYG